jgi:hypothetical protein
MGPKEAIDSISGADHTAQDADLDAKVEFCDPDFDSRVEHIWFFR